MARNLSLPGIAGAMNSNSNTDDEDVTPEELYARAVDAYFRRNKTTTLYPGENYRYLRSFLCRPYPWGGSKLISTPSTSSKPFSLAIISRYKSRRARETISFDYGDQGLKGFRNSTPKPGDVIFLRGYASPQWLNAVGAKYRVDAEAFRRHLDIKQEPLYFDIPSLQSTSIHIISIPLISIGRWGNTVPASDMDDARREAKKGDIHSLRSPPRSGVGSSIVREYLMLDSKYFVIEQQLSVHVHESKDGSWAVVIWSDIGRNLSSDDTQEWSPCSSRNISRISILPVLQYQRKIFVHDAGGTEAGSNRPDIANTFQSASLLSFHHGDSLSHDVAQADALYTLSELFRFCAFSESQFINLISHILEQQRNEPLEQLDKILSNLTYYKRILDSHAERLKVIISCLIAGGGPTWPRATETEHRAIVEATMTVLKADFEQLAYRIDLLSKQCSDDSLFLMNRVVVNDTKRGFTQAQNTADLTLLAFYFIPLTLVTSFFGMNFKEIADDNGPKLSLWMFFVIAVPSLFLAWIGFKYLGPSRRLAL